MNSELLVRHCALIAAGETRNDVGAAAEIGLAPFRRHLSAQAIPGSITVDLVKSNGQSWVIQSRVINSSMEDAVHHLGQVGVYGELSLVSVSSAAPTPCPNKAAEAIDRLELLTPSHARAEVSGLAGSLRAKVFDWHARAI